MEEKLYNKEGGKWVSKEDVGSGNRDKREEVVWIKEKEKAWQENTDRRKTNAE